MLVLIPNQNQIADLVKIQKKFIKEANKSLSEKNNSRVIFYQHTPMWIFLPDFENHFSSAGKEMKDKLKKKADSILKVELSKPSIYFSDNLQKEVLGCHSLLQTDSENCNSELILCESYGSESSECRLSESFAESGIFPLQLKVFRLAWAEKIFSSSWAVTESVWKKTK